MLTEKFYDCLKKDGIVAIATTSNDGKAHIVNTWNKYVTITKDEKLLIPAAGMIKTEKNINHLNYAEVTLGSPEVMGHKYMGAGFLLTGTIQFLRQGNEFATIKNQCPFANRVLVFTPNKCIQTQ